MAEAPVTPRELLETEDMQGLLARAYGSLPFARYLLCGIDEPAAARAWLREVTGDVFTANLPEGDSPCLNLAFTWEGLRRLGLAEDALATFPRPLQEGMVTPHRSRILGDEGPSDPAGWRWGGARSGTGDIDVLVMLFALTERALGDEHLARRASYEGAGALREVGEPIDGRLMGGSEHFGFADGLSQPRVKGWPGRDHSVHPPAPPVPSKFADVEPGEIVLGYKDNFGKPAEGPTVAAKRAGRLLPKAPWSNGRLDLGRNGSLLVVRQLAQDVVAFQRTLQEASEASAVRGPSGPSERGTQGAALSPEHLGAKMVGRWASGAPVVAFPDSDPGEVTTNDFGYSDDPSGLKCPLGAHLRRSNLRDSSSDEDPLVTLRSTMNHRILRRGRPYGLPIAAPPTVAGEEETAERGLLFMCLNADIERQFEFVQHTWLNNPYLAGLAGEVDPIVGPQAAEGGMFTVPAEPVRRRVLELPRFVTTRGGGYFFLPGVRALTYLGAMGS